MSGHDAMSGPVAPVRARAVVGAAILLSVLFLVSGIWKLLDLDATAERMVQMLIPLPLSMPAAMAVTAGEILTAALLLAPRWRRWGAWLAGLMLVAFMLYVGVLYDRLLGEDCNCFPWIQRVVGPAFFAGDAAMLALAAAAGRGPATPLRWRPVAVLSGATCFLVLSSYALTAAFRGQVTAPVSTTVDGKTFPLRQGRVLLYFFDPECSHCYTVARKMARQRWGETRVLIVPVREARFADGFLRDTGLTAGVASEAGVLRSVFPFAEAPYAVALENGRNVATFNSGQLEQDAYYQTLEQLGHLTREGSAPAADD